MRKRRIAAMALPRRHRSPHVHSPMQTVGSVSSGASASLADDTLLQALSYQGGAGLLARSGSC